MKLIVVILCFVLGISVVVNGCKNLQAEISPQTSKLLGSWRVIEWFSPSPEDKDLRCVTVGFQKKGNGFTFELKGKGKRIRKVSSAMTDQGRTLNFKIDNITYRNIILDTDHNSYIAMVGCPNGTSGKPFLFILGKADGIKELKLNELLNMFLARGLLDRLERVTHNRNDCRRVM